jgi:hypothetical protein
MTALLAVKDIENKIGKRKHIFQESKKFRCFAIMYSIGIDWVHLVLNDKESFCCDLKVIASFFLHFATNDETNLQIYKSS